MSDDAGAARSTIVVELAVGDPELTDEVLVHLQERHPEEHFRLDDKGIRGDNRVVYLSNLHRDIRAAPARRSEIIRHFVRSLGDPMDPSIVHGSWSEAQDRLLPILKPRSYVGTEAVGKGLLINEWLDDDPLFASRDAHRVISNDFGYAGLPSVQGSIRMTCPDGSLNWNVPCPSQVISISGLWHCRFRIAVRSETELPAWIQQQSSDILSAIEQLVRFRRLRHRIRRVRLQDRP